MKKIKNLRVFSDGSLHFDYTLVTSIKIDNVNFQKNDYKNSSFYNKKIVKNVTSKYSKAYKKKFFN